MHKIGLHGKSFIPMLIGFGCSVPAIMATRILENRRNRLTTILVIPLMSCGARLTIYSLLVPAFFAPHWRGSVMWSIYLIGIVLAVAAAKLQANYTPLVGFCTMLFCLISAPCMATLALTRQETGSWRWVALQFIGLTTLAYTITFVVFQVGRIWI